MTRMGVAPAYGWWVQGENTGGHNHRWLRAGMPVSWVGSREESLQGTPLMGSVTVLFCDCTFCSEYSEKRPHCEWSAVPKSSLRKQKAA